MEFDYVIVGGGSSGAVLANRLSARANLSVCLLEAGRADRSPLIKVPLGLIALSKHPVLNWNFKSVPQPALDGRVVSIPRGKVLGGSSAINGMIYIRGRQSDYDGWAAEGCDGWDYQSVLPYFIRSEGNDRADLCGDLHGRDGPLSVSDLRRPNGADHDFIAAANQLQIRSCPDFNVASPEGVGIYQVTQHKGKRHSTSHAFLHPVRARPNLHVVTGATAERLLLEDRRVTGLSFRREDGTAGEIRARREIILCAGAIGSPDLLLRSGIGPADDLKAAGQAVRHDLPGVGRNLQDHVDVMVICKSRSRKPYGISLPVLPRLARDGLTWLLANRGMLSSNMVEAGGFVRSHPAEAEPDLQFHFIPGRKSHRGRTIEYGHGVSLHTCVLRPESRGSVRRLAPEGPPLVDLGLLQAEGDMQRLLAGVKLARRILKMPPLAALGLTEIVPGEAVGDEDEAGLRAHIRAQARTVYHPVGTCRMGRGTDAVVDPRLKVVGLEGLRIADASIMPRIVSGNTNAPAIMIGEKAADMILQDLNT